MNALRNADSPIEANQIGAAAKQDVLAIVDDFVDARMTVRAGPAAKIAAALDKPDAKTGLGKGAGRAHAGYAAADHNCRFSRSCLDFIHDPAALLPLPLLVSPLLSSPNARTLSAQVCISSIHSEAKAAGSRGIERRLTRECRAIR
jgi:hypothetical protein